VRGVRMLTSNVRYWGLVLEPAPSTHVQQQAAVSFGLNTKDLKRRQCRHVSHQESSAVNVGGEI